MVASTLNKTYPVSLAPGETQLIESGGNYVYCESADLATFRVAVDDLREGRIAPGMGYQTRPGEPDFISVRVINNNTAPLNAVIVIGAGTVLDNRLSLIGAIETAPAFSSPGYVNSDVIQAALAGNFSRQQLKNPAGSQLLFEVTELFIQTTSANVRLGTHTADFATLHPFPSDALRLGSVASSAEVRRENGTPVVGTKLYELPVGGSLRYAPVTPILIPPGERFHVECDTVNLQLEIDWFWREHPL